MRFPLVFGLVVLTAGVWIKGSQPATASEIEGQAIDRAVAASSQNWEIRSPSRVVSTHPEPQNIQRETAGISIPSSLFSTSGRPIENSGLHASFSQGPETLYGHSSGGGLPVLATQVELPVRSPETPSSVNQTPSANVLSQVSDSDQPTPRNAPWKFEFTPYLWAPVNVDVDLSTSRRTVSRTLTFSQITSALDTPPLSGRLEAWKGNLGLITEGYLIGLSGVQSRSRDLLGRFPEGSTLEASTLLLLWDVAISYHMGKQPLLRSGESPRSFSGAYTWFEPYAGMRLAYLEATTDLTVEVGPLSSSSSVGRNTTTVSPLVGGVVGMQATQNTALLLRGDVSGFGINGDPNLAWRVAALADVQPLSFLDLTLKIGYQVFSFNYGKDDLEVKFLGHGPWIGLTFRM